MQTDAEPENASDDLETAVSEAIEACDGDMRGTVKALIVTLGVYEVQLADLEKEVAGLRSVVSPGYVRGCVGVRKGTGGDA